MQFIHCHDDALTRQQWEILWERQTYVPSAWEPPHGQDPLEFLGQLAVGWSRWWSYHRGIRSHRPAIPYILNNDAGTLALITQQGTQFTAPSALKESGGVYPPLDPLRITAPLNVDPLQRRTPPTSNTHPHSQHGWVLAKILACIDAFIFIECLWHQKKTSWTAKNLHPLES